MIHDVTESTVEDVGLLSKVVLGELQVKGAAQLIEEINPSRSVGMNSRPFSRRAVSRY